MKDELKPCPFCGATVKLLTWGTRKNGATDNHKIHCPNVSCVANMSVRAESGTAIRSWNSRKIENALNARIVELEEALLQAKVAMDYLGDILNNNDVVDAEQNDSAALNPLFVAVDNAINGISNGRERRNEIEAATSERTKQPLDE